MATIDEKGNFVGTGSLVPSVPLVSSPPTPLPAATPPQQQKTPEQIKVEQDTEAARIANQGKPGFDVFGNPSPGGIDSLNTLRNDKGTYTATDGKKYYNYDSTPVEDSTTATQKTTVPTTGNDQVDRTALAQAQADYQATAKQAQDTITNIQNGVIPLTAGEQAQIDGLKQQFDQLIQQQGLTNTGAFGAAQMRGYQSGAAEYDPTFQVKTIGAIVSAGANKIADLQTKEAAAVAQLTQSFKDNDIKAVKDAYAIYQDASKARQDALTKTITDTQAAIKDAQDAKIAADKVQYDTVTKPVQDIAAQILKNTGNKTLAASVGQAHSVEQALALAGDSLQTATGDLGEYLDYKRQTTATGKTPSNYDEWLKAKKAAESAQKSNDAYNSAYATAKGKAAGELASGLGTTNFKPLLEGQSKDFTYAQRGDQSGSIIDSLSSDIVSMNPAKFTASSAATGNALLNQYADPKVRQYMQARYNFILAITRRESGASIPDTEYKSADLVYIPQPGDDEQTLINKAQARQTAVNSFKANVPDYQARVNQTTTTGILNQAEDLAQTSVIDYGSKNPQAQASIKSMVAAGKPYTEIKQLLGI